MIPTKRPKVTTPLLMDEQQHRRIVEALARNEGCDTDKHGVLDVLASNGSFDVQACPGSGKTTTVAAKIVILLAENRQSTAGLCVLTHTNVAKDEIKEKLRNSATGQAALSSPHFVGTIQSFVDTFLAIPYLRSHGISVEQIDNDAFETAAVAEVRRGYPNLRAWLKKNPAAGEDRFKKAELHQTSGVITFAGSATRLVDETRPAFKELVDLKLAMSTRGIFRHGDMYYFANKYIDQYPWAVKALRSRFTTLIIDEMQDTSARQEDLLNKLFPPDVIDVQRFGDVNQAIYDMDSGENTISSFPRRPTLYLGDSRRFGQFIADNIAVIGPQQQKILGNESADGARHTIFLFDEDTVLDVIPAFATLAREELAQLVDPVVKAVGGRKRPSDTGRFPHSLNDYVVNTLPETVSTERTTDSMRTHIERARSGQRQGAGLGSAEALVAIRRIIRLWNSSIKVSDVMGAIMNTPAHRRSVGRAVLALLQHEAIDRDKWLHDISPIMLAIEDAIGSKPSPAAQAYVEWFENPVVPDAQVATNVQKFALPVFVETIHAVKGQNHDATLVLETQFYEHDVSTILPYLADRKKKWRSGARLKMHRRRMFVGMSRPRKLLCIAAAKANVAETTRMALIEHGWRIVDLTAKTPVGDAQDEVDRSVSVDHEV